jgi:hypothetical protein
MLQHARDLNHAARRRGRWRVTTLCLRLLVDGVVNAGREHMEVIMTAKGPFKPAPWLIVLVAAIPGMLIALSRAYTDVLAPFLQIVEVAYVLLLILALPVTWWHTRRFPVWALLPAGLLVWFLIFNVGRELSSPVLWWRLTGWSGSFGLRWIDINLFIFINIVLAAVLFVSLLPGKRLPAVIWALLGLIVLGNILLASLAIFFGPDGQMTLSRQLRDHLYPVMQILSMPAEALMLVAVGLLAARRHGVLAILVVIGGYGSIFLDTDNLFGYPSREWAGLPLYLTTITALYFVAAPVALLRARTRLGRALAVFVPLVMFLVARLTVPLLALGRPIADLRPGDVLSVNILLAFLLAWVLYDYIDMASPEPQPDNLETTSLPS